MHAQVLRIAMIAAAAWACARANVIAQALAPRIVVQFETQRGVEVAAWTPDDRYVVAAMGVTRTVTIWDAASGLIVDRAILPAPGGSAHEEMLRLTSIAVAADGRTATVQGIAAPVSGAGAPVARAYLVDLGTRSVTPATPPALPPETKGLDGYVERIGLLTALYEGDPTMTPAAADAKLPMLPASHDGTRRLKRNRDGMQVMAGGKVVGMLGVPEGLGYGDADLSPDGKQLALVTSAEGATDNSSGVSRFDLATGRMLPPVVLRGDYGLVGWIDARRLLVTPDTMSTDRDGNDADANGPPASPVIVDATTGAVTTTLPPRCYVKVLDGGRFVGAELANCRTGVAAGRGLAVFDLAAGQWRALPLPNLKGRMIDAIAVSPVGPAIALIVVDARDQYEVLVVDRNTGAEIDVLSYPAGKGIATAIRFTSDGQQLIVAGNGGLAAWHFGQDNPRVIVVPTSVPQLLASDGATVVASGVVSDSIGRGNLTTGAAMPPLDFGNAIAGGFLSGKPIFWAASAMSGLRLWDTRDWHVMLTTYQFDATHALTVTPDGRYDTNLGPDASAFRWIVPDAPFQSLSPQTFMRDYFEPRLAAKVFDCTVARNCGDVLKPVPPIASLNRVLPQVTIEKVEPGPVADEAVVRIAVREGVDVRAANGRTRSGVYNVRLFRNGRFVAQSPIERNEVLHPTLAEWREGNGWAGGASADGAWAFPMTVKLPTAVGREQSVFTAYAFNEDRVKSDTARAVYARPATVARTPRAFAISIGIDAYDEDRLALSYAASDATLTGDRLAAIPGYEVRRATLTGVKLPDGTTRRITRDVMRAVFGVLVGMGSFDAVKASLRGVDVSQLEQVKPDDIVILSFSGHGWADPRGDFYLVPSEGKWASDAVLPDVSTLVSSADLTAWLRDVDAAEIAVIIDACHSGASVDSATFKPGPMGDAGLGQLAYDKGMRILAATQASDLAMEDGSLRQGLLTFALAREGLDPVAPKADINVDGRITLDEWLRYATQRLPQLSGNLKIGRIDGASRGFNRISGSAAPPPKIQEPSLFDFTDAPSSVVLRQVGR